MNQRHWQTAVVVTASLLLGVPVHAERTLGDIRYAPVTVEKQRAKVKDRDEIIEHYYKLKRENPERRVDTEVSRRIADLELERNEAQAIDNPLSPDALASIAVGSIEMYESLLRNDPDYPDRDQVLYQLARAYEVAGEQDKVMFTLQRIVDNHPSSVYWAEAQFRRAERFFVLQDYPAAERLYAAIIRRQPETRFHDRALFKQGWALFKLLDTETALVSFMRILDRKLEGRGKVDLDGFTPSERELLAESLRVSSLIFSELGGTRRIHEWFDTRGRRDYEYLVYRDLGDLYRKQERIADAAETYLTFVRANPTHEQAPRLSIKVVDLYTAKGFVDKALDSKKSFTRLYSVRGDYWQAMDTPNRRWLEVQLQTYLKELAQHYHALAQQAGRKKNNKARAARIRHADEAITWYREYLASFTDDPTAGGIAFLLAELLFELERYTAAVEAYEQSAYCLPAHDKAAEAGYAALLAYTKLESGLNEDQRAKWHERSIASSLRFASSFPASPHHATVLTRAADGLFGINALEQAVDTATRVVDLSPPAPADLRLRAWTVIAHGSFDLDRFHAAEHAYQQTLALTAPQAPGRSGLRERLAASIYKQAMAQRANCDYLAAAESFIRVGQVVPESRIRETADFDGAASLIAAWDWPAAIDALERFREQYAQSTRLHDVRTRLVAAYLEEDRPLDAGQVLEVIATRAPDADVRRDAIWQAAGLYENAQAIDDAIRAYTHIHEHFPAPLQAAVEARHKLVVLNDARKNPDGVMRWLQAIVDTDADGGDGRTERTRFLAAHASLQLAEPAYTRFTGLRLVAPLKTNLKRKKDAMQQVVATYRRAAEYGVESVTTHATYRIAEIYRHFGASLVASERPAGLQADELEQYELLLEEQAYPFEEKAISLHQANTGRAAQGIYDEWVKRSFVSLAELLPARYAKYEEGEHAIEKIN